VFTLDHLILGVADLDAATSVYRAVLGRAASWQGGHPDLGTRNTLFRLDNAYVELLADAVPGDTGFIGQAIHSARERPLGLALQTADVDAAVAHLRARGIGVTDAIDGHGADDRSGRRRTWRSAFLERDTIGGLQLLVIQHTTPPDELPLAADTSDDGSACTRVDHVVVFTRDLEAAEALWTRVFGLGVRWRQDFPERSTRNAGLALGDVTLELIAPTDAKIPQRPQRFWGVAYGVADCDRAVARLQRTQVAVSTARPGLFPGTRVANVRWDRTPTLLIGPASGAVSA